MDAVGVKLRSKEHPAIGNFDAKHDILEPMHLRRDEWAVIYSYLYTSANKKGG